ncbi:glutamine amidotransferase [Clostridium estertheticum]|uniref:Glutamine amidotransferase n=1 Tax=Clostridium estertheticum TaxID=238834 RepID=A0AA47EIK5_9CLOT|nr:type 1 glutamine amidotransferase family protein [Clostridium estertheticum]MBU3153470.1 glutamine amidotransferase [Clostridium estertheticum]MBU3198281.1 glutamine amidotransferase [Clostridium estertheticum]WAG60872.1 glutamine amidotransferase [Clostridium estertheticum]WAG64970.1 glutamine amidotransferase [Clostridium estertheticum]
MKKTVLLFLLSNYADWEAGYVAAELNCDDDSNPYCIKTISISKEPVYSIGGIRVLPDYSLETVPDDYEALILIGGTGWRASESTKVVPLVKATLQNDKPVAGICDGSVFLAKHGFLNDVKHTSNDLEDLEKYAAKEYTNAQGYVNEPAVMDGNIITANGSAPLEFARLIFSKLHLDSEEMIQRWYDFNKLGNIEFKKMHPTDF